MGVLSCDATCLQVLDVVGTWIASIGTVAAVGSAIWFANRDNSVRLRIHATIGLIFGDPSVPIEKQHVWITVTNIGRRTVTLNTIGWRTGLLHHKSPFLGRQYAVQMLEPGRGPILPVKMTDGDSVSWMLPLDSWLENEPEQLVGKPYAKYLDDSDVRDKLTAITAF